MTSLVKSVDHRRFCNCGRRLVYTQVRGHAPTRDCPLATCPHQIKRSAHRERYRAHAANRARRARPDLPIHAPIAVEIPRVELREALPPLANCERCGGAEHYDAASYIETRGMKIRIKCCQCSHARWGDAVKVVAASTVSA